jgi:hypothetical protein
MKVVYHTILLLLILVLTGGFCFSQNVLKFKVKEQCVRPPDSLSPLPVPGDTDEWFSCNLPPGEWYLTIDLINKNFRVEKNDLLVYTNSISHLSRKNIAGNDSGCIRFEIFTYKGERIEYALYRFPKGQYKYYTLISSGRWRKDKMILEYILPES